MIEVETALLAAVIAGAFGLGVPWLTGRIEHRRWLRDAQLKAAVDFLKACRAITHEHGVKARLLDGGGMSPTSAEFIPRVAELVHELSQAKGAVELLLGSEIGDRASTLMAAVLDAASSTQEFAGLAQAEVAFNRAVRTKLNIK